MTDDFVPAEDRYQGFPDGFFTRFDEDDAPRFCGEAPGSRPPSGRPSHIRHCSGSHNNVARLGATTDAAQGVCRLGSGP